MQVPLGRSRLARAIFTATTATALLIPFTTAPSTAAQSSAEPRPALTLPVVPDDLRAIVDRINLEYRGDPNYSTIRLLGDRSGFQVYWDGDAPQKLLDMMASVPTAYSASLIPTGNNPGRMRDIADQLLEDGIATSAGFAPAADALEITVPDEDGVEFTQRSVQDVPIRVVPGEVEPASRFSDTSGAGGTKINLNNQSNCTAGYTVYRYAPPDYLRREFASITAAHCGLVGESVRSVTSNVSWGTVLDRAVSADMLLMHGVSGGGPGAVWFGDAVTPDYRQNLATSGLPVVGDEICVSGAVSGSSCGHIVQQVDVTWDYAAKGRIPAMNGITGILTDSGNGMYVGPGDSGGPGLTPESWGFSAVSLISGIRGGQAGYCDGGDYGPVPEDPERVCSDRVLHTLTWDVQEALGWDVYLYEGP